MNKRFRKPMKWTPWGLVSLMTITLLWLAPLAFPHPLFDHKYQAGCLTFYSDSAFNPEMQAIANGVKMRLQAIEIYDPAVKLDVFLCRSPRLYRFFSRLTLVPPEVPGFYLSQAGNSFLSLNLLEERRRKTAGWPEYSAIGGELGHTTAHELVHNYAVSRLGYFKAQKVPRWISEGFAEYAASLAVRRDDPDATLPSRIEDMKSGMMPGRAREYYSWSLTIEYLGEIQGLTFDEQMSTSLTFEQAYNQMIDWYATTDGDT